MRRMIIALAALILCGCEGFHIGPRYGTPLKFVVVSCEFVEGQAGWGGWNPYYAIRAEKTSLKEVVAFRSEYQYHLGDLICLRFVEIDGREWWEPYPCEIKA